MRARTFLAGGRAILIVSLALLTLPVLAAPPVRRPRDPLIPMLHRMDRYFQRHEVDGVTMDSRYSINPSEAIRMSVVCQLLGYTELYRVHPTERVRIDIVQHADYLIGRLADITSHTPFDGMLTYSLLVAYESTGESRFLATGTGLVDALKAIRPHNASSTAGSWWPWRLPSTTG